MEKLKIVRTEETSLDHVHIGFVGRETPSPLPDDNEPDPDDEELPDGMTDEVKDALGLGFDPDDPAEWED